MAAKTKVAGATICGRKKHAKDFTVTGPLKGNYAVSVCDKDKHTGNDHEDSQTGERWSA